MKDFIEVHTISSGPGNPVSRRFVRVQTIGTVCVPSPEFAKIGAGCAIDTEMGTLLCTEHIDDVVAAIEKNERVSA